MGQLQEDIATLRDLLAVYEKLDATQPGARALRRALARLTALAALSEEELEQLRYECEAGIVRSRNPVPLSAWRKLALILGTEGGS